MGFNYDQLTKDAKLRTFIKFTEDEPTIEGVVVDIGPLTPNSFNQKVYTYYIRGLKNGVVSELSNGSSRLMKEFIRLNVEPGDTIRISRQTTAGKPMDTKYEVVILEKGDGRIEEVESQSNVVAESSTQSLESQEAEEIPF